MTGSESTSTLCSCTEICKHQQKINQYTCCASDNYNCLHACDPDFNVEPDIEHAINDPIPEILPNLSTMLNLEDLKQYIQNEIQKAVKPLEEENKRLRETIENLESQICTIKGHLNLDDFFYDSLLAKGITPFCDQVTDLKKKIESAQILPIEPDEDNRETFDPTSKVQKSAVEFLKFACDRPVIDGSKSVTNSVLKHFRKHVLPEELRPKETASREWKSELKEVITQLAPCVKIDKKGNGDNRGIRFVFPRNFTLGMLKRKLPVSY